MCSGVCPGVCLAVRTTRPRSIVSPSLSFSHSNPYAAPPSTESTAFAVPVREHSSRLPETKSAWMWVSRT